jgi:hypothetical protein
MGEEQVNEGYGFQILVEDLDSADKSLAFECELRDDPFTQGIEIMKFYPVDSKQKFFELGFHNWGMYSYKGRFDLDDRKYDLLDPFYDFLTAFGIDDNFAFDFMPDLSLMAECKVTQKFMAGLVRNFEVKKNSFANFDKSEQEFFV